MVGQLDLKLGLARKERGITVRIMRDPLFAAAARQVIERLAEEGHEFTSDEVHERMTVTPTHPNSLGAAMHAAKAAGLIEQVGWRKSERPQARARVVAVYRGRNAGRE